MSGGPYTRVPCAHEGCSSKVRRRNLSGLCIYHYNEQRALNSKTPRCSDCGNKLKSKLLKIKDGLCQCCRNARKVRTCSECGHKHMDPIRKSGRCNACQRKKISLREQVGEDRLGDYYLLRSRGLDRDQAVAHLDAGLPVERKIRNGGAKLTTMQAVRLVGEAMAITPDEILSASRFSRAVDCRAVVAVVMVNQGASLTQIGRRLNRDHTSILHLRRTFPQRAAKRPVLAKIVETILRVAA